MKSQDNTNINVRKIKKMLESYQPEDFELVRFFSYKSIIPSTNTIFELDESNSNRYGKYPNIKEKFNLFFEGLVNMSVEKTVLSSYYFNDNKVVFQIRHKFSGQTYFIGHYDMRIAIGNGCYVFDGRIYDFSLQKLSNYVSDIRVDERNLWTKFNI